MLKRHRILSPVPSPDLLLPSEPSLDVYERAVKRRRQLAPLRGHKYGSGIENAYMNEEDDEAESKLVEGFSDYARGKSRWQEEAGLYKAANTLLHDLHAEQRHRVIFSSSSPHHHGTFSDPYAHDDARAEFATSYGAIHAVGRTPVHAQNSRQGNSDVDAPPRNGNLVTEDVEVQNVTHRYEDTNRLLGSLFLSRNRYLDTRHGSNAS